MIACIKQSELKGADPQIDMATSPSSQTLNSVFCNELNLSTTNPPPNRIQITLDVVEIEDQNLHGPESNIDCINMGGKCETVCFAPSQGSNIA